MYTFCKWTNNRLLGSERSFWDRDLVSGGSSRVSPLSQDRHYRYIQHLSMVRGPGTWLWLVFLWLDLYRDRSHRSGTFQASISRNGEAGEVLGVFSCVGVSERFGAELLSAVGFLCFLWLNFFRVLSWWY
jgi:hypothetical protein